MIKLITLIIICLFPTSTFATWTTFNALTTRLHITDTDFDVTAWTVCAEYNKLSDGEGGLGRYYDKAPDHQLGVASTGNNLDIRANGWDGTNPQWTIDENLTARRRMCIAYDASDVANNPLICWDDASKSIIGETEPTGVFVATTAVLNIGNDSGATRTWDGQIGDFTFYTEAFASCSEAQAVVHYGWMARPKGIKAYIPMGTFAGRDYSGNGNNFTEAGTIATSETGPARSSVQGGFIWLGQ